MKSISYPASATMKDVAIYAGVSTATVSRVFTAPEKVSTKTRLRVESAAQTLGYSSNAPLPRLATPYWRRVLVIIADITNSFYCDIIRGIETHASQQYCLITLLDCAHQSIERYFTQFRSGIESYDGLIFVGLPPIDREKSALIPMVVINEYSSDHAFPTVHIDNLTASYEAVKHLIMRGHQRIACLTGPEELAVCQYRRQGYLQALQRHNIPLNPYYLARGDFSFVSGIAAIDRFFHLNPAPDAIFCHNDKMALGAMYRAKQLGVAIPKQLSIIGFDDIEESQYADPPLSTVSQPKVIQGKTALTVLITLMEGKSPATRSHLLATELILRQSTR